MSDEKEVPSFVRDPGPWEVIVDDGGSSHLAVYVVASSAIEAIAVAGRAWPRFAAHQITRLHRKILPTDLQYTWEDLRRDLDDVLARDKARRARDDGAGQESGGAAMAARR